MKKLNDYRQEFYRGLYPSDESGKVYIMNPERGFRYENMILLNDDLVNPFTGDVQNGDILKERYQNEIEGERYQIVQQYIYLSDYVDKDLDKKAFNLLNHVFEQAKSAGVKFLLRFAYKFAENSGQHGYKEPSLEQLKKHMHQLRPYLNNGVVYAFQFGWVGIWAEQHDTVYTDEQKTEIYRAFYADFMPSNRKITMRYKNFRDMLINKLNPLHDDDELRIGYNNDFYTLDAHKHASGNDFTWNSDVYNDLKKIGVNSIYDIEMPYDGADEWQLNFVPQSFGWGTIYRFTELGASTFSIAHNTDLCIKSLRTYNISVNQFEEEGFICDRDYFWGNENEKYINRTAFDYIRDHLGYRLVLEEATYPESVKSNATFTINFIIKNYGFAKPVNTRPIAIVLLNDDNEVIWESFLNDGAESCKAGRAHSFSLSPTFINIQSGKYRTALWLPDENLILRGIPDYDVRLANSGDNFTFLETDTGRFNIFGNMDIVE